LHDKRMQLIDAGNYTEHAYMIAVMPAR